ncbi:hypothetical protein [Rhizobium ruizarguesonis]|uniref:hypothetical protein n=1 Tax=Rhizobium ruizarguesonis TaxID=2081791 RepID=UPI00040E11E5|nr:hypothetical protein [Rhizobium ruizarguesonis]QJS29305.1 hypothetical protein RLTA1_19200 [Rhizobium leguminosarum bv. trifolii TA1]UFW93464.1 hypothetical protein RlegTA1_19160 [Rhizobium ruizarguesonis]
MQKIAPEVTPQRPLALLALPPDLIGNWDDTVYVHTKYHPTQPFKIIWERPLAIGNLTDPQWAGLWEMCRRYYCYLRGYRARPISRATAFGRVNIALRLVDWLVGCGYSFFAEVPYAALQSLVDAVEEGIDAASGRKRPRRKRAGRREYEDVDLVAHPRADSLTKSYLAETLHVIWELYDLYSHPLDGETYALNDGFRYSMFDSALEAFRDGHKRGRDPEQTDDVSEELVFQYTDAALQYVFDYADDIIVLKERLDTLPPAKVSDRARPGERVRQLAEVLAEEVWKEHSDLFDAGEPIYSRIAAATGIEVTTIYRDRFKSLIVKTACARRSNDTSEKAKLVGQLGDFARAIPRRKPAGNMRDRDAAALVGLPFVGKERGSASPWPIEHVGASHKSSPRNIEAAVTDLWTSIAIIILAWQTERTGQLLNLDIDCLEKRIDGWYLKSRVFKDKNDTIGSPTIHACPDVVVRAVQVAIRLGAQARLRADSTKLFLRDNRLRDSVSDDSSLRDRLGKFGRKFVRGEDADKIRLIPRHLRRFFPTLWVHYYSYGVKFRSLQRHLDHASLTTTVLYGRRFKNLDPVRQSQTHLAFHLIGENVFNGMSLFEGAAKKVQSILARLNFKLSEPADFAEKLNNELTASGTRVYPLHFGYCLWDREAIKKALCTVSDDLGDVHSWPKTGKSETICGGGCTNFFTTSIFQTFWEFAHRRHREMEEDERAPALLRDLGRKGKRIAQRFLRAFNASKSA